MVLRGATVGQIVSLLPSLLLAVAGVEITVLTPQRVGQVVGPVLGRTLRLALSVRGLPVVTIAMWVQVVKRVAVAGLGLSALMLLAGRAVTVVTVLLLQ